MNDVKKYSDNGYIQMLNIIANYILKETKPDGYINYGFAIQKYDQYKFNDFAGYAGVYYTFFAILSYLCPLILYVLKMVVEKESRSFYCQYHICLCSRLYIKIDFSLHSLFTICFIFMAFWFKCFCFSFLLPELYGYNKTCFNSIMSCLLSYAFCFRCCL